MISGRSRPRASPTSSSGRDTLIIMPTGGGKSLCYQLPALIFPGMTVVVSPLISLMQDQVSQLLDSGVAAAFINSTLAYQEQVHIMQQARNGEIKLLYMAPETLLRPEMLVLLDDCKIDCLAIDEAHCISSWGHDFRPEYRQLRAVRDRLPQAICVALTATATPRVQTDIAEILGFSADNAFIGSFNRENLFLAAEPRLDGMAQLLNFLSNHRDQSGIIYCSTRKDVEGVAYRLGQLGWSALPYHAGLDSGTRRKNQEDWVRDNVPIMVATVAFGMGIDKSNVRFVAHYNLPQSVENYYQEIGRAGRDGLRSDCLLLYSVADMMTQRFFIDSGAESEKAGRSARLQAMWRYAEAQDCRRIPLLAYFGETLAEPCGSLRRLSAIQRRCRTEWT
jgi:ATP-dependent DNA helicase RecQ